MIETIRKIAAEKGYVIYEEPYRLNIWGFRANSTIPNAFDDEMHVFTNISKTGHQQWAYMVFRCTTDPGTFWLKHPSNVDGTAILNPGQYVDVYGIRKHKGQYYALCQSWGNVSVTRDYNRDAVLDFNNGKVVKGSYGINIHHSSASGSSEKVDKWSAGCQVFKNIADFNFFMQLCYLHKSIYGNKFTYTLVDKRMEERKKLKTLAVGSALVVLALGGAYFITADE